MKKNWSFLFVAALAAVMLLSGCGKKEANKPGSVPVSKGAIQIAVNNEKAYQKIDGFGAAYAFYEKELSYLTKKQQQSVYDLIFKDAKLSILRFKNSYDYPNQEFDPSFYKEMYDNAKKRLEQQGEEPTVLLSSWSPAAYLKSNERILGIGSTLRKKNGKYVYDELGKYFAKAVKAYQKAGIPIDVLSIQNECDFSADYDGCQYSAYDESGEANYAKAYLATYKEISKLKDAPAMIGPETMTANAQELSTYMRDVYQESPESISGVAFHLYSGTGEAYDMVKTNDVLKEVNNSFLNQKKWQCEYGRGTFMDTAKLIQSCLYYGNLNAYIYWAGIWNFSADEGSNNAAMIMCDNIYIDGGYKIGQNYYALRHFSEFVRPGYYRMDTKNDEKSDVLVTAFANEKQDKMAVIALNSGKEEKTVQLQFANYQIISGQAIVSKPESNGKYDAEKMYNKDTKAFNKVSQCITIPAGGVVTVDLTGRSTVQSSKVVSKNATVSVGESVSLDITKGSPDITAIDDNAWNNAKIGDLTAVVNGDHGASASYRALYDEKNLYIRVDVEDKTENVDSDNHALNDGVEIFVNENNKKPDEYGAGDAMYRITRNNKVDYLNGAKEQGFKSETKETEQGYSVVVAIPWNTIKGNVGTSIGFDIGVNDNHAGGEEINYAIKWCDSSSFTAKSLADIGTLNMK